MMPTLSIHTHYQVAQSQPHEPKLVKEYVCSIAEKRKENKARKHNKVYSAWLPSSATTPYTER